MPDVFATLCRSVLHVSFVTSQVSLGQISVPLNPLRLILLVGFIYLSMYCVQRVQYGTLVPRNYKPLANTITLFTGPLLLLILLVVATARKSRRRREPFLPMLKAEFFDALTAINPGRHKRPTKDSAICLMTSGGKTLDEIYGHGQIHRGDARRLELTEAVLTDAVERRASDILIDPQDEYTYIVHLRIDGILKPTKELDVDSGRAVINSIKAVSGMDISERRRSQDGAFVVKQGDITSSLRVASAGAVNGEKLSIRVLNKNATTSTLSDLGLSKRHQTTIEHAAQEPSGMILICGPTGSGKTTTMYAMLNAIDRFQRHVITVEDPIEAVLAETSQIEVRPKAGITFASTLIGVLRQDPDVICIGEIRDQETAEIALRAAQTDHLVLATMHSDSNATAIIKLLDLGVSPLLIASGLRLLVSQRLVRCLCEHCKEPAGLSESQIAQFSKKKIDVRGMCQAGQCRHCDATGYVGRTAVCDLMTIDKSMKADMADAESFRARLKNEGTGKDRSNLRKEGLKKVVSGVTSLNELKRVIG